MTFQLAGNGPQIYEEVLVPLWFGRWAQELIAAMDLRDGQSVLDVACGTGGTTRIVKQAVGDGRVEGLDINAGMLETAAKLADGMGINWLESDAGAIDRADETYDVILSQHGYHYFPDKPAALATFHRLLKSGGSLGFSIWDGPSAYTAAVCDAVEAHLSPKAAATQRAQRTTPSADDLLADLTAAGFRDCRVIRQELMIDVPLAEEFVPNHLASMPIAAAFLDMEATAQSALIAQVAEAMADYVVGDRMVYADQVHVAIGVK